jgi:hypothetical protein
MARSTTACPGLRRIIAAKPGSVADHAEGTQALYRGAAAVSGDIFASRSLAGSRFSRHWMSCALRRHRPDRTRDPAPESFEAVPHMLPAPARQADAMPGMRSSRQRRRGRSEQPPELLAVAGPLVDRGLVKDAARSASEAQAEDGGSAIACRRQSERHSVPRSTIFRFRSRAMPRHGRGRG